MLNPSMQKQIMQALFMLILQFGGIFSNMLNEHFYPPSSISEVYPSINIWSFLKNSSVIETAQYCTVSALVNVLYFTIDNNIAGSE
jgi:hypothetical protein